MQKKLLVSMLAVSTLLAGNYAPPSWSAELHPVVTAPVDATKTVLTLEGAIRLAIENSPRLRSSEAGLEAAKGAEAQAGYWINPELGVEAENIAGTGQYRGTDSAEYTYGFSQTFEIGGKRYARKQAALAVREAAHTEMLAEKLTLARDVHIAYAEVLAETEALKLAKEQEQLAEDVLKTVSDRVQKAAEPEIQKIKAEVAHSTSIITREQEERQLRIAEEKLARLWGEPRLEATLDRAHFFELEAPAMLATYQQKLAQAPDSLRLAHIRAEKQSELELEQASAIPDPNVSLGVRDDRGSGDQAFVLGVSLPIPVWNQNGGNIARARAELKQAEQDARQAGLTLEQELTENWQHWYMAYSEAERLQTRLIPAAEKAFKLARQGYEKGKFPYLEVLDAQRTLVDARAQYHEALKRYHTSRANVERLAAITE